MSSSSGKSVLRERMKKRAAGNGNSTSLPSAQGPCDHPAVVGGLCAVCGADTRSANGSSQTNMEWLSTRKNSAAASKPIPKEPLHVPRKVPRKDNSTIRQEQILEKQKNIANSLAAVADLDQEMASIDMDAIAIPRKAAAASTTAPQKSVAKKPAASSTGFRSLSSLLSGAMTTQKILQSQGKTSSTNNNPRSVPRQNTYASNNSTYEFNSSDQKMTQMTVSGGATLTISESEAKKISAASAKKLTEEKKLCLVLDLDHTLLHATDDYRASRFVADEIIVSDAGDEKKLDEQTSPKTAKNDQKRDDVRTILLPMELPPEQQRQYAQQKFQQQEQQKNKVFGMDPLPLQNINDTSVTIMRHYIKLRPHLKEFLTQIQSTYQLSVYTAGTRAYAEQVAIMICRHLVGATLDEEGVNTLRGKLREKDAECRRYQASVARQKQLELAKERSNTDDKAKSSGTKKAVKFDHSNEEDEARKTTIDLIVIDDSDDDSNDGERTSSGKRSADNIHNGVPRKKAKSVNFCDLPPSEKPSVEAVAAIKNDSKISDPTVERNRLKVQLEEAEKLEVKAVQLRRKLFGSRIVSRTDVGDLGKDVKSLKRVFPCGGVMAAILDDREDVWANAKNNDTGRPGEPPDNLLLVKPYHWKPFQGYADVNNASGQDLSESDDRKQDGKNDDEDGDQMLLWTADILRRLHERYYSAPASVEKSVPDLLRTMRRETLRRHPSAKVVLSGLIPIHKQNKQSQIRPPIVRYAEELGAEVLPDVTQGVTHVVAARDGSSKIHRARKEFPGCYVVHTAWLMECYWSITRRDETAHHMGPLPKQSTKPPPTEKSSILFESHDEESDVDELDDDDFAAALENDMMDL